MVMQTPFLLFSKLFLTAKEYFYRQLKEEHISDIDYERV